MSCQYPGAAHRQLDLSPRGLLRLLDEGAKDDDASRRRGYVERSRYAVPARRSNFP